ncbi:MAG TPA: tRNA (adenosine(37)-N6)-threonylcarbamoyltransferase complex dimerization subunit type 1 TsaB [Verrucomicrobiales bacterium]|nr:tRNA (adenosine(37)-N6)-threonylcarbamoyltransferase complex dimerization subunit type 1 TsaB [Verrucomicrobiales bacterium]
MKVLVVESSTSRLSLAWFEGNCFRAEESIETERGRDSELFPALRRLLDRAGDSGGEAEMILVGLGPGSYSGVRIGIAVAQGLSLGWGARVAGRSSLLGLEVGESCADYHVVGDARRGLAWIARVCRGELRGEFVLQSTAEMEGLVQALLGQGAVVVTPAPPPLFPGVTVARPRAELLGRVVFGRGDARLMEEGGNYGLEPIYLAPPYITQARKRRGTASREARGEGELGTET